MKRSKKIAAAVADIYNLGSPIGTQLDFNRDELWTRMDTTMGAKAVSIPVFLVNERQMDKLYPPQRRRVLDPKIVREKVKRRRLMRREREEETSSLLKELEEYLRELEQYIITVTCGLYMSNPPRNAKDIIDLGDKWSCYIEAQDAFLNLEGPSIYLCPERIVSWAMREDFPLEIVLDKVYYHELGHAIMDSGDTPYDTLWGRIIEESSANWIAYNRFKGSEARLVQKLISTQPAEYQGYAWLSEVFSLPFYLWWELLYPREHYEYYRFLRRLADLTHSSPEIIYEYLLRHEYLLRIVLRNLSGSELIVKAWIRHKREGLFRISREAEMLWQEIAEKLLERI